MAFFEHAEPAFKAMAELVSAGRPAAAVMQDRAVLRQLGLAR
jgi:hypothetical protein